MKIEIAEPGKMTQSGSSLLKLIQNNKTPSLDLFVRESVQNSLDARKEGSKCVNVEYLTGDFDCKKLAGELEGITESMIRKYPGSNYTYLAVCDSETVGLTGETDYSKVIDNNYGNVLKLIYEICKPQENEGAGGSWGIGKTVYFRMGIGLVIYYSRILKADGSYESRLAASFVEDEKGKDAMIPVYNGMPKRGIAWWGESTTKENDTVPVTDEKYIREFLDIFGISPYSGDKTGTVIIIPFTNEKNLLENNQTEYLNTLGEPISPYWCSSIKQYLEIALQRWYAPRLANPDYPYGAFLRAAVNGEGLSAGRMEPVFQVIQAIYNRANRRQNSDIISINELDCKINDTGTRSLLKENSAGTVACVRVSREVLKMNAPWNKPDPSVYLNCEQAEGETNKPFVLFVRKPGMIVSYESMSKWTPTNVTTSRDEYIFGIFVLNSLNEFINPACTVSNVEEYVRKSEMADHTSWNDWSAPGFNPRLVSKIQGSVSRYLSSEYAAVSQEHQTKENSALSKLFGDMLLPPDGFGNNANTDSKPKSEPKPPKEKKFSFKVNNAGIRYYGDTMDIPMVLKTAGNKKIKHTAFEMLIDSESGKISILEWIDKLKLETPFTIEKVKVFLDSVEGAKVCRTVSVDRNSSQISEEGFSFSLRMISTGEIYGLDITAAEEHAIKADITAVVRLVKRNVRPTFTFEKEV